MDKTVIIGEQAAYTGNMTSAADGTVSIGSNSGKNVTSAAGSTFVGFGAGASVTTGNYNTAFGYSAGNSLNCYLHYTQRLCYSFQ